MGIATIREALARNRREWQIGALAAAMLLTLWMGMQRLYRVRSIAEQRTTGLASISHSENRMAAYLDSDFESKERTGIVGGVPGGQVMRIAQLSSDGPAPPPAPEDGDN